MEYERIALRGEKNRVALAAKPAESHMSLLEAHRMIIIAKGLGIPELISEAIENHEAEKAKRRA